MKVLYQLTSPMEKSVLGRDEINRRREFLRRYASPGVEVDVRGISRGPASIESSYEAALVVPELVPAVMRAQEEGFTAAIIGCFGDPGLDALREVASIPIVGPGSAAIHLASQIGIRFAIISPRDGGGSRARTHVRAMGLESKLASVRGIDMSVIDIAQNRQVALERACEIGKRVVEDDGADVLVLGCMSIAFLGVSDEMQVQLGIPVLSPVTVGLKTAEMLASLRIASNKRAYPFPPKKEIL